MNRYLSENFFIARGDRDFFSSMPEAHTHNRYEIFYVSKFEGTAYMEIGDERFSFQENCLFIIDSQSPHQSEYQDVKKCERFLMEISPSFFQDEVGKIIGIPIELFFKQYQGIHYLDKHTSLTIENILTLIYDDSIFKDKYYENIVLLRIMEIVLLLDRVCESISLDDLTKSNQSLTIRPIAKYIVENLNQDLSLEFLSQKFYLDKCYLSRAFKQYTGSTVHEFINFKKIDRAKRLLLLNPETSIHEIATCLGFRDAVYFSKVFRKYIGTSPSVFRKSNIY